MPSLTVVGMGIQVPAHVTSEVRECLEIADEVLYLLADPVAGAWVEKVNPNARSLHHLYRPGSTATRRMRPSSTSCSRAFGAGTTSAQPSTGTRACS